MDEIGRVGDIIKLTNDGSKGRSGGLVLLNAKLKETLIELWCSSKKKSAKSAVIADDKGNALKR